MSFFSSLFGGSNPSLNSDISSSAGMASFLNGTGMADASAASKFNLDLLSGDPSKQSSILAPEISGITGRAQQQKLGLSQFGNRSGGTTAATVKSTADTGGAINDLIAKLTSGASSSLASEGSSLLSQGEATTKDNAEFSQQQMDNWRKSILGSGITGAINYGESFLPVAGG